MKSRLALPLATAALWLALEGGLRAIYFVRNAAVGTVVLPYTAAQDWGPVPPWLDGLRILEPDPVLLWRNRPGVRRRYLDVYGPAHSEADRVAMLQRFWPPRSALRDRHIWEVSIGEHGFRTEPFASSPPPRTWRIACLGDSWTFGANVDQRDAFPQRLGALLAESNPTLRSEVLNLGVMGYSSRQGLELLRRRALALDAHVVLIGFAMNDAVVAGWHDADTVGVPGAGPPRRWLDRIETLRLTRYLVKRIRYRPWTLGDYLVRVSDAVGTDDELWTGRQAAAFADETALERLARVPPSATADHLREMVRLVRARGGAPILLYNELWDTPYRRVVSRVAREEDVPWIDAFAAIGAERERREAALSERLGLQPAGAAAPAVILRVHQGANRVPRALFVAGSHPALGDGVPNRVALHDDGTRGDERAGDGVWSLAVTLEPGERVFYTYTNSGRESRWEGVDVPDLRHLAAPGPGYRPIESFGELVLQADGWHTDADGHALIARALLDQLVPPGWR